MVRSLLEYNSLVSSSPYAGHINRIEQIQSTFVRFLLLKLHFPCDDIPHTTRLLPAGLQSLEIRGCQNMALFVHKLYNGVVSCSVLLANVNFKVNRATTLQHLFLERVIEQTTVSLRWLITDTIQIVMFLPLAIKSLRACCCDIVIYLLLMFVFLIFCFLFF